MAAAEVAIGLHVTDHGFDGRATCELAFDQFIWTGSPIAIGYFLATSTWNLRVNNAFDKASAVSLFVIVMLCFVGFMRYMQRRMFS
jgi:hypothetical protein